MRRFISLLLYALLNRRRATDDRSYAVIELLVGAAWYLISKSLRPVVGYIIGRSRLFSARYMDWLYTVLAVGSGALWISQWVRQKMF